MSHPSLTYKPVESDPELTVSMKQSEWRIVIAAVNTVTPTGGCSTPFLVADKLQNQLGMDSDDELILKYLRSVLNEAKDAGVITSFDMGKHGER